MEHRLLVAKEPLFWIFRGWKIRSFLSHKVDGNMIFIDYWKFLFLYFSGMGNTVFFWDKKVNGKMIFTDYWKFHDFGYQKVLVLSFLVMGIWSFFSQKVDVKVIFAWSFWAFYDIREPGKYGFLCSEYLS